ncbi:hypothetical protein KFK09_007875 [Dendrobium nobile]|uniref:Uncharacterized protein n=1 Tax=Dendrobium nobile TaxID=94219 RepID=A0A8T3BY28_DENNO|nr:hypothetical protein KFK09_007875 [Dendrobium nobile]
MRREKSILRELSRTFLQKFIHPNPKKNTGYHVMKKEIIMSCTKPLIPEKATHENREVNE